MLDINFITLNGNGQETSLFWKILPIFGTVLGSYLGFFFGNKQAKRKEKEADKRYFNFVIQFIEDCERASLQLIHSIKVFQEEFDLSDNNSFKGPSLEILKKFDLADHSRVFDVIYRHREFTKTTSNNEIVPSAIFDLIKHVSYVTVGVEGILNLLEINNKQIITLRTKFIEITDDLSPLIKSNEKIQMQLQALTPANNGGNKNSSLIKPQDYNTSVIPLIKLALKNDELTQESIIEELVRKCCVIYANIETSNSKTLSSPENGGIKERGDMIEESVKGITKFIDDYLFRTRDQLEFKEIKKTKN